MNKKIRTVGVIAIVALWALLVAFSWFGPRTEISEAERRPLAQMPEIKAETIFNGKFMSQFEDFALDQFPLRDTFRQVKSLFHYYVLGQKDNNDIYIADGYAVKQEYPYNADSVVHALDRFNHLYEKYLKDSGSEIYMTIVPDKGYYLGEENGHLTMDYDAMFTSFEQGMPWAQFVDITGQLTAEDYYFTDTHWRQERLDGVAEALCKALDADWFRDGELTLAPVERPFYGVYYGQAALPMEPERLTVMNSDILKNCTVYNHETGKTAGIYDWEKLESKDLYDVYLSGAAALLTIENPNAKTEKELVVFRDSFGSSLIPLLLKDYKTVTVVDIRYIASDFVGSYVDFHGQDVLFLYSALVLNSSTTLK